MRISDWSSDVCSSDLEALVQPFLDAYEREIGLHGRPFDGVEDMLAAIEADGARWGIVTNKSEYLARQVLPAFGWDARSAILVGGDTLAERKPHPLPLLHSAQALRSEEHTSELQSLMRISYAVFCL